MASLYNSEVRSTQNMGVTFFSCMRHEFSIISPCFSKGKVFFNNSNLTNLVDTQF